MAAVVPLLFHLSFTWVTLNVNDRYLFGGISSWPCLPEPRAQTPSMPSGGASLPIARLAPFVYALLYAASINVIMSMDARLTATAWVAASTDARSVVGLIGRIHAGNRGAGAGHDGGTTVEAVRQASPDLLVLNARFARRFELARRPEGRALLLGSGGRVLGYDEVFRYRAPLPRVGAAAIEAPFREPGRIAAETNPDSIRRWWSIGAAASRPVARSRRSLAGDAAALS